MDTPLMNALLLAQASQDRLPHIPDNYIGFAWLLMLAVVAALWVLTTAWVSVKKSAHVSALKEKMIERGMSADEIERVLAAGTGKQAKLPRPGELPPPAKPQAGPMNWPVHSNG